MHFYSFKNSTISGLLIVFWRPWRLKAPNRLQFHVTIDNMELAGLVLQFIGLQLSKKGRGGVWVDLKRCR